MLRNVYDNDAIDFDFDIANMNLRIKEPEREPYGYRRFVSDLYKGVSGLNFESYRVKMRQKVVRKYQDIGVLASLTKDEANEIRKEISPLMGNTDNDALATRRFDHLMLAVLLDSLLQKNSTFHIGSVIKTVKKL